jgi:transposase-like protein
MLHNWSGRSGGRDGGSALRPNTPAPAPHSAPDPAAEISRLRRENDRRRMERDILKNCGHLLGTPEMKLRQIEDQRGRERYGAPRIHAEWRTEGQTVSRKQD